MYMYTVLGRLFLTPQAIEAIEFLIKIGGLSRVLETKKVIPEHDEQMHGHSGEGQV